MDPGSIPSTAVVVPFGSYDSLVMPFGLRNSAQTFQRFVDEVKEGLKGVYIYLDDILVASASEEEHWEHLRALFRRLDQYGLITNPA